MGRVEKREDAVDQLKTSEPCLAKHRHSFILLIYNVLLLTVTFGVDDKQEIIEQLVLLDQAHEHADHPPSGTIGV